MIIDFANLNGGGGGSAQYATSAGTSNNSKLLLGASALPQSANTGDVVAIGAEPLKGKKSGAKAPVPSIESGVYQYDGSDWNKLGGEGSGSSAYEIELSTNNPDDFTEEDIVNLNAFFAAVIINPSIMDTAYLKIDSDIYHLSYASYNEEGGEGEFGFILSYPNWTEYLIIGYQMEEFSWAENRSWGGNTLVPALEFPQDPAPGEIANYDDGEGNVGLYQYDADNDEWVPFGGGGEGGDVHILKSSSTAPEGLKAGDVYSIYDTPLTEREGMCYLLVDVADYVSNGSVYSAYIQEYDGEFVLNIENGAIYLKTRMWNTGKYYPITDFENDYFLRLPDDCNPDPNSVAEAYFWVKLDGNDLYIAYDGYTFSDLPSTITDDTFTDPIETTEGTIKSVYQMEEGDAPIVVPSFDGVTGETLHFGDHMDVFITECPEEKTMIADMNWNSNMFYLFVGKEYGQNMVYGYLSDDPSGPPRFGLVDGDSYSGLTLGNLGGTWDVAYEDGVFTIQGTEEVTFGQVTTVYGKGLVPAEMMKKRDFEIMLKSISGYDESNVQYLTHNQGTLIWMNDPNAL